MEKAKTDKDVVVLCSDSRGSASMTPFAENYPEQFVEVGIAEQNLVSISAGLAKCGKKAYAVSPVSYTHLDVYKRQEFQGPATGNPFTDYEVTGTFEKMCIRDSLCGERGAPSEGQAGGQACVCLRL